jgi:hypothetical protein
LTPEDTTFVVFASPELIKIQDIVHLIETLARILPVVSLVLLIAYLALSTERRWAIIWAALTLSTTMVILLSVLAVVRWLYLDGLDPSVDQTAAVAFYDILLHDLRDAIWVSGATGLAIAGIVAITRPGGWVRREWATARQRLSSGWVGTVARWRWSAYVGTMITRHRAGFLASLIGGCCLAIILLDRTDRLTVVWVTIVALLAAIGLIAFWTLPRVARRYPIVFVPRRRERELIRLGDARHASGFDPGLSPSNDSPFGQLEALSEEDLRLLRRLARLLREAS